MTSSPLVEPPLDKLDTLLHNPSGCLACVDDFSDKLDADFVVDSGWATGGILCGEYMVMTSP